MSESGLAAASSFIQDFGRCSSPRTASPMPQPYGTPVPWPNGDGGLSELGPNTGIRMKAVTMLAGTFVEDPTWHRGRLDLRAKCRAGRERMVKRSLRCARACNAIDTLVGRDVLDLMPSPANGRSSADLLRGSLEVMQRNFGRHSLG